MKIVKGMHRDTEFVRYYIVPAHHIYQLILFGHKKAIIYKAQKSFIAKLESSWILYDYQNFN